MGLFSRGKVEDRDLSRPTMPASLFGAVPYDSGVDAQGEAAFSPLGALRLADVWACVKVLADTAASLPLVAYRRDPVTGGRERFSGRITDLLAAPAPATSTANLIGTLMCHLNLTGNCFIGKYRDGNGQVAQLGAINPYMINVRLVSGVPEYTLMRWDGVSVHGPDDIVHIKSTISLDGILGLSPIRQCAQALGLASSLAGHADSFARNGGRPSGILRVPGWRSAQGEAPADIRSDWESKFAGSSNSGKLLLLVGEDSPEYTQLSLSFEDAQFVDQRQLSTAEIARLFKVPPWMIGAPVVERGLTYTTTEMLATSFVRFSLAPWLVLIEQALTNDRDLSPQTVYVEFDLDGLLRADAATRAQVYTAALNPQTGWMTRAEVRQLESLPEEAPE